MNLTPNQWSALITCGVSTPALRRLKIRRFLWRIADWFVIAVITFFSVIGVGTVVEIIFGKPLC
jgi:hypothetical protein